MNNYLICLLPPPKITHIILNNADFSDFISDFVRCNPEYLLWDVLDAVFVKEKLYEVVGYASRHLSEHVVGQIELHQAGQILEGVPA